MWLTILILNLGRFGLSILQRQLLQIWSLDVPSTGTDAPGCLHRGEQHTLLSAGSPVPCFLVAWQTRYLLLRLQSPPARLGGTFISPSKIFATYQELQRLLSVQAALGKLVARNSGAA